MDAFAVTGVSRGLKWFRLEGVVGGVDTPARRYPRMHIMQAGEIAALAVAGRRVYFAQVEPDAPLVPLSPAQAARFDARHVPAEELPRFAFLEQATDDDPRLVEQ